MTSGHWLLRSSCTLERQASVVCENVDNNFLELKISKYEVVVDSPRCIVKDSVLPVRNTAKCLGYWWSRDLFATKCVDETSGRQGEHFLVMVISRKFKPS